MQKRQLLVAAIFLSAPLAGLAGCSDRIAAEETNLGCKPVSGIADLTGRKSPAYVIIGEFTETNEAPAAFAEIACHMAAAARSRNQTLFVGVSEYFGGATDAETRMRARLDQLAKAGAPIVVDVVTREAPIWSPNGRDAARSQLGDADRGQRRGLGRTPGAHTCATIRCGFERG